MKSSDFMRTASSPAKSESGASQPQVMVGRLILRKPHTLTIQGKVMNLPAGTVVQWECLDKTGS